MRADGHFDFVHNLGTSTQDFGTPARGVISGIRTRECTFVHIPSGAPGIHLSFRACGTRCNAYKRPAPWRPRRP